MKRLAAIAWFVVGPWAAARADDALPPSVSAAASAPSFRHDVMAVFSKAGCNLGTCHGNRNGKGGFKLSLRGDDPTADYLALTREFGSRRVSAVEPADSLLLRKPLMEVPHEGGARFRRGSWEHQVLLNWLGGGLPDDPPDRPRLTDLDVEPGESVIDLGAGPIVVRATARFSDGSVRDVSRAAVYEPVEPICTVSPEGVVTAAAAGQTTILVRYLDRQRPVRVSFLVPDADYAWRGPPPVNVVDEQVFARLRALRIRPAAACDDATFLRRISLDLLGRIPTEEEARQFAADGDPGKRARAVDRLLDRPEFADFWSLRWADLLRNEEKTLDFKGTQNFRAWIREQVAADRPLTEFARDLLAARGSTYSQPAANYYRALRDPIARAETTAQLFLGVRLQCARCHAHPFDRWTQTDYYAWANLFSRVDYKILENRRRDQNDAHEFDGEQIVFATTAGELPDPRTGRPQPPRFLGEPARSWSGDEDRLLALADWMAQPDNRRFHELQVNRAWAHLFGRGIVDPIDDFRATNPAVNPGLLDALVDEFAAGGFRLKPLLRTILRSQTYQFASLGGDGDAAVQEGAQPLALRQFARGEVRRLTAEQLLDSASQAAGVPLEFNGYPRGTRAVELAGVAAVRARDAAASPGDAFLRMFGKPPRLQSCDCERSNEATLNQSFELISGRLIHGLVTAPGNALETLLRESGSAEEIVDRLVWRTLGRPPTEEELRVMAAHLERGRGDGDSAGPAERRPTRAMRRSAEDLLWSLMTSPEFLLRR